MKTASKFFALLTLAFTFGASQAQADEFWGYQSQEDFPVQKNIETRQIHTIHSLRNWQCAPTPVAQGETVAAPVLFPTAQDTLTPEAMAAVHHAAAVIKSPAYRGRHILVSGYTDSKGNAASNQRLSYHRATMVVKELVKDGVPPGQLTAQGFGAENPVASNATAEGRAANRRVTFTLAHHQM